MRRRELHEIVRDVDVACAIAPIARSHRLSTGETAGLLSQLSVPRARAVAELANNINAASLLLN